MKPNIKLNLKYILLLSLLIVTKSAYFHENNFFYKTYQDYLDSNSIEGYSIVPETIMSILNTEYCKVKTEAGIKKMKTSELPSDYYVYHPYFVRRHKGHSKWVLVNGYHCFYQEWGYNQVYFYSEGIEGKMIPFNEKILENLLTQYNLLDQYNKEKPRFKDYLMEEKNVYFKMITLWKVKYFTLLNESIEKIENK
jgi:hypothetical protein